ncbi:MAG: T9SS type A sorting domain-containing protein [Elusimicrobiota bacterium]
MYVSGGSSGAGTLSAVRFAAVAADGTVGPWTEATPLPAARDSHAMAAWGGRLYVAGGFDGGNAQSTVWWAAVLEGGSLGPWRSAPPLPGARHKFTLTASAGALFAVGGDNGIFPQSTVYAAAIQPDGTIGPWSTATALPAARAGHGAAAALGRLYISGGVGAGLESSVISAPFSGVALGAWTAAPALPAGRTRHAMTASPSRLYIAGGHDGVLAQATVWSAPLADNGDVGAWQAQASLPAALYLNGMALLDERLAVVGGSDGAAAVNSVTIGNLTGTEYLAESANDAAYSLNYSSSGWRRGAFFEFSGLIPNTTYYARVRGRSLSGVPTSVTLLGSTITLAAVPQAAASTFTAVEISSIGVQWTAGSNPAGTEFRARASTAADFSGTTFLGGWGVATSALFNALALNTSYYFEASGRNAAGQEGSPLALGAAYTRSAPPVGSLIASAQTTGFSLEWSANGNPAVTRFEAQAAIVSDFSTVLASSVTFSTAAAFSGLPSASTFYARVRALNGNGLPSSFDLVVSTMTGIDGVAPVITNNQTGDLGWRRTNNGLYNVDFLDAGGSKLAQFAVKASTVSGGAGPDLVAFTDVAASINADTYLVDWPLPAAVFAALLEGATNYISLRVVDGAGNVAISTDTFFVKKDTTAPVLVDTQTGDGVVRSAPGTTYTVAVYDLSSALASFQYSVSLALGAGDASLVAWTNIPIVYGATDYATAWPLGFASLLSGVTNYVSVRAWDVAGTTSTLVDAFSVLKDTAGPSVALSAPVNSSFVSSLSQISGTAASPFTVKGTEVSVLDVAGGFYWNPTAAVFNSAGPVWMPASGTSAWTLPISVTLADGATYRAIARSSTTLDVYSATYATATFIVDRATPTVGVVVPAANSTVSALPSINGTAADAGAGVSSVEARLRRNTDGQWWNWFTQSWGAVQISTVVTGTTAWSLTPPPLLLANLRAAASYYIAARASDGALPSNQGDFFFSGSTFTWQDTTPPSAVADLSAVSGSLPGRIDLTWTAPGDDGASGSILLGQYRIFYSTDVAAVASTTTAQVVFSTSMLVPGAAQLYSLTGLSPGATYFLRVALDDGEGNWSSFSNQASTVSAPSPFNAIIGHVVDLSSQGITAVQVDCWDAAGAPAGTTFTLADGSGTFNVSGLSAGSYKLKVTWTVNGISSSLWQDGIAMGSAGVDFTLEINYSLATLTGTLATLTTSSLGRNGGLVVSAPAFAAANSSSRVELFQGGRQVAQVAVKPSGRWSIPNLLPGKYAVRAYTGSGYTDLQSVELTEGEVRTLGFVFDPLPKRAVFAFPNPARSATTIRFATDLWPLEADITVFDLAGNLVREFPGSSIVAATPGVYHAAWDLTNSKGQAVVSGVYIVMVKIKGGSDNQTAKVIKKVAVVR